MRVASGRFDTDASGDAGDNDLCDTQVLQVLLEARVRERSPLSLRHRVVSRLLVQLRDEIGPSGGKLGNTAEPVPSGPMAHHQH